eukprot:752569-Hanusia_phi.AAC.2
MASLRYRQCRRARPRAPDSREAARQASASVPVRRLLHGQLGTSLSRRWPSARHPRTRTPRWSALLT